MDNTPAVQKSLTARAKGFFFSVYGLIVLVTIAIVLYLSLTHLATTPKIWIDEASTMEQSRNLMDYGTPDIQVAPGTFSGVPYLIQSTGYPVKISLVAAFEAFGYGFTQVRVVMLAWLIACLFLVFYTAQTFFGKKNALFSFLLTATFASFYANGLTAVGEVPGFVFLLAGLLCLRKESYGMTGLLWGLAVVTKPSNFEVIVPAIIIALLIERAGAIRKIAVLLCGMVPAAILWFIVARTVPTIKTIKDILNFYLNTYGSSPSLNVIGNLKDFLHTPTLLYFAVLFVVIGIARFLMSANTERIENAKTVLLYDFTILYSLFAFLYYLRSPGWLRYILVAELLILFLAPHALFTLSNRFLKDFRLGPIDWKKLWAGILVLLLCVQIAHFVTGAKIFYSDLQITTAAYLNEHFPNDSIAIYDSLELAVLLNQKDRYQVIGPDIIPASGIQGAFIDPKPLSVQPPIDLIVFSDGQQFSPTESAVLKKSYTSVFDNGYVIYRLKNLPVR